MALETNFILAVQIILQTLATKLPIFFWNSRVLLPQNAKKQSHGQSVTLPRGLSTSRGPLGSLRPLVLNFNGCSSFCEPSVSSFGEWPLSHSAQFA